ncbi:MAG: hypothetical protein Q6370_022415 [Candidatus Sigynarchaeota archaeon]
MTATCLCLIGVLGCAGLRRAVLCRARGHARRALLARPTPVRVDERTTGRIEEP